MTAEADRGVTDSRPTSLAAWPAAPLLTTERLSLEPLTVKHAQEMAPLLDDAALHAFTGGQPLALRHLRRRYGRLVRGGSADGAQRWFNWVVRLADTRAPLGTVQATVTAADAGADEWTFIARRFIADLAWVIARPHQVRGYATEAASAMAGWLRDQGADVLAANIHPRNEASARVARALGLAPTAEVVDGEVRWACGRQ